MSDPMKSAWDEVAESFSALGKAMKERYAGGPSSAAATPEEGAAAAAEGTTSEGTSTDGTSDRGSDPTAALREAFDQLLAAGRQFSDRAASLVRDDEVKAQARHVATSLNSALEATVEQIGQEVRGFFKGCRDEDGSIDTSERPGDSTTSQTSGTSPGAASGEVQPPPASPEGDVIP